MVTCVAVDAIVVLRQRRPDAPDPKDREVTTPDAPAAQVMEGPPPAVAAVGAEPRPPATRNVAHSLAMPVASPMAAPPAAAFRA